MEFHTLRELRLPHIEAANGIIIGNAGRRFLAIFIDDCGQTVGLFEFYSDNKNVWHDFKRRYIDLCRRLKQKPWRTPTSIDTLYNYIGELI